MGVPKVTRTRYPPSRSAKPPSRRTRIWGPESTRDSNPLDAEDSKAGVALRKSPGRSPGERSTPAPASRAGLPAYLAGSCAPCCPSRLRGAALAAARSGRTNANCAVGRGPGPRSGRGASRLHGRACRRQLGRPPGGRRRRRQEKAEPPARTRQLRPRLLPPPTAREGGAAAPHLLKVCTGWREPNRRDSRPRRSRAPRPGQEDAPGSWVPAGCRACQPADLSLI